MPAQPDRWSVHVAVIVGATLLAVLGARDYAGAWNDGSRLAMVEAIVDYHTLAIDDSCFLQVTCADGRPYGGADVALLRKGTLDRIRVAGRYYSDKSPAPALPMAVVYQAWQWCGGGTVRTQPEAFCLLLTLIFAGGAYVVAVWCVFATGRPLGLPLRLRLVLTASFGLATVALTYSRHVNNHILLLAAAAALFWQLAWLGAEADAGELRISRIGLLGLFGGIAYSIDLGAGPVLFACVGITAAWRVGRTFLRASHSRNPLPLTLAATFVLAALPGLLTHHILNYEVGGTFKPANANPEYFVWPGSPFSEQTMTGARLTHSVPGFVVYAASMLFGKRGFVGHNLPLFLALPALVALLRRRGCELPEALCAASWAGGTWLAYALTSNNSSGLCCSIRWFVPLLAAGYYVLAVFLRDRPEYVGDLLVLSGWGTLLSALMWFHGPWITHMVPAFWPIQAAALLSWLAWRRRPRREPAATEALPPPVEQAA